jgi:hypothetical protein
MQQSFCFPCTLGQERRDDSSCHGLPGPQRRYRPSIVLDLNAAFHQSSEQDAELAAFVTEDGLYQMRAMPFGLTNAPVIMQRLIDRVLAPHKKSRLRTWMTSLSSAQTLNST